VEPYARTETVVEVEQFLYYEAHLLDERRFEDWLGLFTADARYLVRYRELFGLGTRASALPNADGRPLVDEDVKLLALRIQRLGTRLVHAEQPPSITRHFVSNVLVQPGAAPDVVVVHSNCVVSQVRPDISEHTLRGGRHDVLRRLDGQWRLARREVMLDTATLPRTLTVFL
jgi:3-phenylpropionate/cinnamic acid dioxygenase small subunit